MNPGKLFGALSSQGALLAAAGLVVTSSAVVGSGTLAGFQAQTTNPNNVFTAGILRMSNVAGTAIGTNADCVTGTARGVLSSACAQLFDGAALHVPGDVSSNTVTVKNEGNVASLLSLGFGTPAAASADTGSEAPSCDSSAQSTYLGKVAVDVLDGSTTVGSGTLASPPSLSSVALGAGASKIYTVKLTFSSTGTTAGDNAVQNCKGTFTATWTLDQRAAATSTAGA